ncbi:MAG TPA: molybdate ABC transporter substrate-binding protein [Opitutales bacterium]|nr:molybdate ABC transporter substrate-binding protein [Opitutales bacterium]
MNSYRKWIILACAIFAATVAHGEDVLVCAAASLKDALTELAPICAKTTGVTFTTNLDASGVLARQIQAGAPGDLFISADEATMDSLDKAGLLQSGSRADVLGNSLVVVVPSDSTLKFDSAQALAAAPFKHFAIGDPKTVPAGNYAVTFLQNQKVYDTMKDKLVPLGNVRAVLVAVESSNADAGMVYLSDAHSSTKSKIAWNIPAEIGPKIVYPLAVVKASKSQAAAEKVRQFLLSKTALEVFVKWGFAPPPTVKAPATTTTPTTETKPAATAATTAKTAP